MATRSEKSDLYRMASIGTTLMETLDELVSKGSITPELACNVVGQFDKSIIAAFKQTDLRGGVHFKGKLDYYRRNIDVWTFFLKNCTFEI
ncbi:hypothetical protein GOP47_0003190, partial [Adiantum capillus-veneris]